jgi:ABC-2 type transport system permease protein
MTAFLALIRKDLILFLSDRRALIVSLALPIVIGAFFGYVFGGSGAKGSAIEIALVLQDTSESGRKIAAGLTSDPSLHVTSIALAAAQQAVRKGDQKVAVVIPAGFGEAAGSALFGAGSKPEIALLYDPSQPAVLAMVKGMLTQQVMQVVSADMFGGGKTGVAMTERSLRQLEASGKTDAESVAMRNLLGSVHKFQSLPQPAAGGAGPARAGLSMPFTTRDQQLASGPVQQGYNGYAHAFAGMGVQFILFMGIDMGIGILLARRSGVWSRLLAAPVTLTSVLLARLASGAIIAFALLSVIFAVGVGAFGVQIASLAGFVGVALTFSLMTAGFGLLIAAFGKTPEAARGMALFATLIMVMLGGAWMPSFMFPQWMQQLTLAVPTRWAIDGLDAVTWRGLGLEAALPAMAVQLGFALVFGGLAIAKFRREQG